MKQNLLEAEVQAVTEKLHRANSHFQEIYKGESSKRQPVHTVYGGSHLFKASLPEKLGKLALRSLEAYAPNFIAFAKALKIPGSESLPLLKKRLMSISKKYEVLA